MKQLKILFVLLATLLTECCFAQFTDNFSDGDFTNNPTWSGETSKFSIVTGKIKLSAPAVSESSFLSTPSQAMQEALWEFGVQLDFNPSATNYAKIYLASDQQNLRTSLNGYFIKIGNTTHDICLYRQNMLVETKIIDGPDDRVDLSVVKVKIKVTRSESGEWRLLTDVKLTGTYLLEGSAVDNVNTISSYFGIVCTYTATRSDKFWFDDFVVTGIPIPDTTSPSIVSLTTPTAKQVRILFSESLQLPSAQNTINYSLGNIGSPASATMVSDQKTVLLEFLTPMTNGVTYSLHIEDVSDLIGNKIPAINVSCLYFVVVPGHNKDVILTELFPDTSPQIGLPNAEFVEIYNRSSSPFNVNGWKLTDGSSTAIFPSQIILPGEYWIVTSSTSGNLFTGFGKTIGLLNFPTLNNDGDTFVLKDASNKTIDSVSYEIEWYHDPDKQQGGWTLELIDPANPCGEGDNWTASEDKNGGTPGRQNSVFANKPDISAPILVSVFPTSSTSVVLTFNEKLDPSSLTTGNFTLQPSSPILRTTFIDKSLRSIKIETAQSLQSRKSYIIEMKNIIDCNENSSEVMMFAFGLPEKADSLDVTVNEILFNPSSGGVDFVEINNRSDKFINLKSWKLGNYNQGIVENAVTLFLNDILLRPNSLMVFTTNPSVVTSQYSINGGNNIVKTPMPSLSDDQGSVAVIDGFGKIIDEVGYSKTWHSVFIKSDEGVSLERISLDAASNDKNNWTSASSRSGFGTPGLLNSQHRDVGTTSNDNISVIPEIFSPGSGVNNFVQIQYRFDEGQVANVKVYDTQGHLLKTLVSNEFLGVEGSLRWDGDRDDGTKTRMGYYFVWFETFTSSGLVSTFRRRVIVSSN